MTGICDQVGQIDLYRKGSFKILLYPTSETTSSFCVISCHLSAMPCQMVKMAFPHENTIDKKKEAAVILDTDWPRQSWYATK